MLDVLLSLTLLGAPGPTPAPPVSGRGEPDAVTWLGSGDGPEPCTSDEECLEVEWVQSRRTALRTTDTLFVVPRDVQLVLQNLDGDIRVQVWDRPQLRVQAEHAIPDRVVLRRAGRDLQLAAERRRGMTQSVRWTLTVPRSLALSLSGLSGDIKVVGTHAPVQVQAIAGDVKVLDASGPVEANSVEGQVVVVGARGRVTAGSVNNDVLLQRVLGQIDAETVNGSIRLEDLESRHVNASSVNGRVLFKGPFLKQGRYSLASHNGELLIGVPDASDARVQVNTWQGEFRNQVPEVPAPPQGHGRSFSFTLGEGNTEVDLESFNGMIQMVRLADLEAKLRALDAKLKARETRLRDLRAPRAPRAPAGVSAPTPVPAPEPVDKR